MVCLFAIPLLLGRAKARLESQGLIRKIEKMEG